jgi:hydrogenase maturation protein HypF
LSKASDGHARLRVSIQGLVQGVGFRPFVYRLADGLALGGGVRNTRSGATIEVEGTSASIEGFLVRLKDELPAHARLDRVRTESIEPRGETVFSIWPSESSGEKTAVILPDLATCELCRAELLNPTNRRFRYPFTNCTHCGPRFSILLAIPYDRPNTTMSAFEMCPECRREYDDPRDRRFHAQPNACPVCGPQVAFWSGDGARLAEGDEALAGAVRALRKGEIVAVKGLGGFHLMADATSEEAVQRLRQAKAREEKPFALMAPHLDWIAKACVVSPLEREILTSRAAPIALLGRRREACVAPAVAPGNPALGVMLPYTPLHHLLLRELSSPVVATSGNRSDEPICIDEREALERLRGIADVFLVHDRPIARPIDDSVVRVVAGRELLLRRARGYAPLPIPHAPATVSVLALGAHLKSAVALLTGDRTFVSQHIGDLDTSEARSSFHRAVQDLPRLYDCVPDLVACDAHPDYASTQAAERLHPEPIRIQHHHAHVVSCMADSRIDGQVLGVAWDGTGYGPDGTVWGGEFLLATAASYTRVASLRAFSLPGGETAVREPRRSALGLLFERFGPAAFTRSNLPTVGAFTRAEMPVLEDMLSCGVGSPRTSSVGRLFDALASLVGSRQVATFEGQAAMELEYLVDGRTSADAYPFDLVPDDPLIVDWAPLLDAVLNDLARETPAKVVERFHNALVEMIVAVAGRVGERRVVLSGGCFQNAYLTERSITRLREAGHEPFWHHQVPPNDGGIALGQAIAAAAQATLVARRPSATGRPDGVDSL